MKSNFGLYLFIMCLFVLGCTAKKENNLQGVWRFSSGVYNTDDETISVKGDANYKSYKYVSKTRYAVITQDTSKQSFGGHSGTYRINGDEYTETFEINKNPNSIGSSFTFKYKIEGNEWTISNNRIHEVWIRVE
jgi:hypothetical protein